MDKTDMKRMTCNKPQVNSICTIKCKQEYSNVKHGSL